ncbi:MAG: 5-formyltetrahydrofolate cyclo-ligase [Bacteroidota bacterium]|nr:5-formyltetrahydrofolate cyclo-ligase [Ignavibacteria bacterium]MCU7500615.1 5-formyltetrahydrofolate cyclo-ligase [Ignavibacteria bacterium]MCU7514568.1 5-formyltetrahydrofolate cyclo-ligase [Ignavibacteria bacterium]MCU7520804.1 5-formyltetrahydrofolate cyclo-ligase [Ignavibacteria bacterium]MCU7526460.1 5-formyltetrahydrofolate cyclo-ligase [Ignavibacteria bacterium]
MALLTLIPKSEARKKVLEKRRLLTPAEASLKTERIIAHLKNTDEFNYAKKLHIYISTRPGEVDTRKIIDFAFGRGKEVFLPKFHKENGTFRRAQFTGWGDLIQNSDGYWEPGISAGEDLSDIDLFIVPAIAISKSGQRVGQGGGHYDRLLKKTFAPKMVAAFEFQVFDYIESDLHDVRIDKIVTELRVINTRENGKQ